MNSKLISDITYLIENHIIIDSEYWQSINIDSRNPIVSVFDISNKLEKKELTDLIQSLQPNLPWAEDHFKERVSGFPLNPGVQYKNWPFYQALNNDELFRSEGTFSHSYMERFWCKGFTGIRYKYGDLNDIILRLKNDKWTRQAFLSIWHPEDQSNNNVRIPCTIGYWFYYDGINLNMKFLIRSCDAIRHYNNDLYMSYRLLQYVSEKINIEPGSLSYWIGSFHCFKSDLYSLKKIVKKWG